jgi:hypothetical protein
MVLEVLVLGMVQVVLLGVIMTLHQMQLLDKVLVACTEKIRGRPQVKVVILVSTVVYTAVVVVVKEMVGQGTVVMVVKVGYELFGPNPEELFQQLTQ